MKTIILPGYSQSNKDWAVVVQKKIKLDHDVVVHEWGHWYPQSGTFSVKKEVDLILKIVGKEKVNFITKSVGTRVLMNLTPLLVDKIEKAILCGIPTKGESKQARSTYSKGFNAITASSFLCIQNSKDPFANYEIVENFVHSINPGIKVVKKTRSDHHYPFVEDFEKFLK